MSTLQRAIEIATEAHKGQFDKAGREYIGHPIRVMEMGKTEDEKIIGVLHDVIEDTDWTFERLEAEGFSQEIINALRCVTKTSENENYDDFIDRKEESVGRCGEDQRPDGQHGHPNAYDPWTEEADEQLKKMWSEGVSVHEIADHFGRKSSAIITRMKKLGI